MNEPQVFSLTLTSSQKAIDALQAICPLTRNTLKDAMHKGAVWFQRGKQTQRIRRQDRRLHAGDQLFLYYNQQVLTQHCPEAELLADEGEFSVWYKPCGMLSQGSRWSDHCTINRWAETHIQPPRPAFIVNRLDRAAQGLMLISHSKSMARELSRHFEQHSIHKAYIAAVDGKFSEDQVCNFDVNGQSATSHIYALTHSTKHSLVKIVIETGRKHQIRTHL
ncbi:MAG: RNA pseudouridine synthase, partial [Gammaproteobacteria bacterium]|nr:RNA pseudouridine synthase [Gammaproteobacteria bacterium]